MMGRLFQPSRPAPDWSTVRPSPLACRCGCPMIVPLVRLLVALLTGALPLQASVPSLSLVGHGRVSAVYDIEAAPPYAFALESGLLNVIDVRNPAAVREVGSLAFDRGRSRMAMRFPYLYLTGFSEPLGVVDISTPTKPRSEERRVGKEWRSR